MIALERPTEDARLPQWRCPHCGWLLFKASVTLDNGEYIEAHCRGCRRLVTFTAQPQAEESA